MISFSVRAQLSCISAAHRYSKVSWQAGYRIEPIATDGGLTGGTKYIQLYKYHPTFIVGEGGSKSTSCFYSTTLRLAVKIQVQCKENGKMS